MTAFRATKFEESLKMTVPLRETATKYQEAELNRRKIAQNIGKKQILSDKSGHPFSPSSTINLFILDMNASRSF
jgi:hypothetical protein